MMEIETKTKEEFLSEITKAEMELAQAINKFWETKIILRQRRRGYAGVGLLETLTITQLHNGDVELKLRLPHFSDDVGKYLLASYEPQAVSFSEKLEEDILKNFK